MNRDNYFSNEFIFGKSIENLYTEDLIKILEKLHSDYFKMNLNSDFEEEVVEYSEKKSIFKSLSGFKSLFSSELKPE